MPKKYQNFINGKWVDANSGQAFENRNPANWDEVIGTFPKSSGEDVDKAVKAARAALKSGDWFPSRNGGISCARSGTSSLHGKRISHG